MVKAAASGAGVTLLLMLIPIVHFVTIVPSPFIGGFIGGSKAEATPEQAVGIGLLMGAFMALPIGVAIVLVTVLSSLGSVALFMGVGVLAVAYIATLGSLGAMYGGRAARNQANPRRPA